jgi:hypothetical protein
VTEREKIAHCLSVLRCEIEHLESLGLQFAASLVRIAEVELQMRLHNVNLDDIDLVNIAASAVERERYARQRKDG